MADRFDLDAIEADDAFLDLLAAGGESAWQAGEHDPALKLLADLRLAVEVEDELPVETIDDPESFLARCAALNPVTDPFARKLAARGLALGVAAVAALSVSGVAAAVTGNPLSPYEKVIQKIADGLRPETSFPKEQLDGLPVVDKTKLVKVAKYNQQNAAERQAQEKADSETAHSTDTPQAVLLPPLALPQVDKNSQIETQQPLAPPVDPPVADPVPSSDPTGQPTAPPSDPPTDKPTDDPSTPPTDPPSTTPVTPPPSETTDPATTPTTTPPPSGSGSTGDPGETPVGESTAPAPSVPAPEPSTVGSETSTGTDTGGVIDAPAGTDTGATTGDLPAADVPPADVPAADVPTGEVPAGTDPVSAAIESVVAPVLPTPTGAPVEEPARLEEYFGKGFTGDGKHSSGKPALGWAKAQYAKGKHSTGHYAEGKHAAITRAHGSMAPVTIKQILGVLNTPMSDR